MSKIARVAVPERTAERIPPRAVAPADAEIAGVADGIDPVEPLTFMGLRVDRLDGRQVVRHIMGELDQGRGGWVATPNLDILRLAASDQALHRLLGSATLVLNDGAPLEWAGKLSGQGESPRAPGASVFWLLVAEATRRGRRVLLLGGRADAGELAAQRLRELHPGLSVATHCPPWGFEYDAAEMTRIRQAIAENDSDIVFCGFGCPKQERLMAQLHPEFPKVWFLGVGGSIDFAAGLVPRAPEWVQRMGHEWVFRLAVEPRRLARRYLVQDVPFAFVLFSWALQQRWQRRARPGRSDARSVRSRPPSSERMMDRLRSAVGDSTLSHLASLRGAGAVRRRGCNDPSRVASRVAEASPGHQVREPSSLT